MKEIKLSQKGKNKGKFIALVDDEDYEYLNQWRWSVGKNVSTNIIRFYAIREKDKSLEHALMHRAIINPVDGLQVDHIDHNGLNNQKSNLRLCTNKQNAFNRNACGRSKYKGVNFYYGKNGKEYIRAAIKINGVYVYLGTCKTEIQAAKRYDAVAKYFQGEFATLNFKGV